MGKLSLEYILKHGSQTQIDALKAFGESGYNAKIDKLPETLDPSKLTGDIDTFTRSELNEALNMKELLNAFKIIEEQVNTLNQNVQRSIQHIDAVNSTSHTILKAIESVQKNSQKSAEDAQNISASTEEQAATMHEMADASNQLAILAQNLQNEVQKFKV